MQWAMAGFYIRKIFEGLVMSDCFDHMVDAYEDFEARGFDEGGFGFIRRRRLKSSFSRDPLYYHTSMSFLRIVKRTEKAILFEFDKLGEQWVPEKLCRQLDEANCTVSIYKPLIKSIMNKLREKEHG
ncbi:hypothetical protein [Pseudomonas phage PP21]